MNGRGLFDRARSTVSGQSEESVVKEFLTQSDNYQKLKKIRKDSLESKKGTPIFTSLSQLHPSEEKEILQLNSAKSFAELLRILNLNLEKIPPAFVSVVSGLGNIFQKANAEHYSYYLAKEATEYAKARAYDVSVETIKLSQSL